MNDPFEGTRAKTNHVFEAGPDDDIYEFRRRIAELAESAPVTVKYDNLEWVAPQGSTAADVQDQYEKLAKEFYEEE